MTQAINNFHLMAKPAGSRCNLNCVYCYYLEKERLYAGPESHRRMDAATLENYVSRYINAQQHAVVDFIWQGGEPTLMGIDYFRHVVQLQNRHRGLKQVTNAFQTNGININDEWAAFFKKNNFLVGLSIDGDRISNDRYRVTRSGKSSFDAVLRAVEILKRHQVEFNTLTVVNAENVTRPLEVYDFLKQISRYMQFIPLVERQAAVPDAHGLRLISPDFSGQCRVTGWSVPSVAWGEFMNTIFDHWVQQDVGKVFVMNFEQTLAKMCGNLSACVINETCGANLVVESNGDVYSCDHFVYPENKLGNINRHDLRALINSAQHRAFALRKRARIGQECLSCGVRRLCNGGCPKHRFILSSSGRPDRNYLCEGYATHLFHVIPKMNSLLALLKSQSSPEKIRQRMRLDYLDYDAARGDVISPGDAAG